jgi:hypothetical protein
MLMIAELDPFRRGFEYRCAGGMLRVDRREEPC